MHERDDLNALFRTVAVEARTQATATAKLKGFLDEDINSFKNLRRKCMFSRKTLFKLMTYTLSDRRNIYHFSSRVWILSKWICLRFPWRPTSGR